MWLPFAKTQPHTCGVERKHGKHDVVQPERGEGVVEHEARHLRAVSLAAALGFPGYDAEGCAPVAVVEAVQAGVPDGPQGLPLVDGEHEVVFAPRPPLVPVPLLLCRHGSGREPEHPDGTEVVDPTPVERQQILPQRPERHALPGDVQDRFFATWRVAPRPHPSRPPLSDARYPVPRACRPTPTSRSWREAGSRRRRARTT